MALNLSKKDIEQLEVLRRKQRAVNKQRAEFKKLVLENREYVLKILKEDEEQRRHFVG